MAAAVHTIFALALDAKGGGDGDESDGKTEGRTRNEERKKRKKKGGRVVEEGKRWVPGGGVNAFAPSSRFAG